MHGSAEFVDWLLKPFFWTWEWLTWPVQALLAHF